MEIRDFVACLYEPMDIIEVSCYLSPQSGRLRALFYEANSVLAEHKQNDGATIVDIRMPRRKWLRLLKLEGLSEEQLLVNQRHNNERCYKRVRDGLAQVG